MAARRTLAAGSARGTKTSLRPFPWDQAEPDDPAAALKMGAAWRDLSGRPRATERQSAGVAIICRWGRMGPAFLAYQNFAAYTEWNNSLIYSITAGYLAHPHRRQAPPMLAPLRDDCAIAVRRASRIAATIGARRAQCRQGRRRHGPAKPQRGESNADQIRPARRISWPTAEPARAHARRAAARPGASPVGAEAVR